jgi:hypothetical protein
MGYVLICLIRLGRTQEPAIALERIWANFPGIRAVHFLGHPTFEPFSAELSAVGLPH